MNVKYNLVDIKIFQNIRGINTLSSDITDELYFGVKNKIHWIVFEQITSNFILNALLRLESK